MGLLMGRAVECGRPPTGGPVRLDSGKNELVAVAAAGTYCQLKSVTSLRADDAVPLNKMSSTDSNHSRSKRFVR